MKVRAWFYGLGMATSLFVVGPALQACGGGGGAKFPVQVGVMPADQQWAGVYYNPVYGYLHMVSSSNGNIVGRWKRTDASHWGELSGTNEGNVLRFTWKEHSIGAVGPSGDSHGNGVFVYKMPAGAEAAELDGQYALDESDSVGQWHCVKQNNLKPDLRSIDGQSPDSPVPHDQWQ